MESVYVPIVVVRGEGKAYLLEENSCGEGMTEMNKIMCEVQKNNFFSVLKYMYQVTGAQLDCSQTYTRGSSLKQCSFTVHCESRRHFHLPFHSIFISRMVVSVCVERRLFTPFLCIHMSLIGYCLYKTYTPLLSYRSSFLPYIKGKNDVSTKYFHVSWFIFNCHMVLILILTVTNQEEVQHAVSSSDRPHAFLKLADRA